MVEVVGSVASTARYDVPTLVDAQLTIRGHITGSLDQARELLNLLNTGKVSYSAQMECHSELWFLLVWYQFGFAEAVVYMDFFMWRLFLGTIIYLQILESV